MPKNVFQVKSAVFLIKRIKVTIFSYNLKVKQSQYHLKQGLYMDSFRPK